MAEFTGVNMKCFCQAVSDLEKFIHGHLDDSLNEDEVKKLFEKANFVEKGLESLNSCGLRESFYAASGISNHNRNASWDISTIGDQIMTKFLSLRVNTELALFAVRIYLSIFGEDRFARVSLGLVKLREVFMKISSFASIYMSPEVISCSLACQAWLQSLNFSSEKSVLEAVDKTIENDPAVILEISSLGSVSHFKPICDLIYCQISQKLKAENLHSLYLWPVVLEKPQFFQGLIQSDSTIFNCVEENLVSSGYNFTFVNENWSKLDETFGFSLDHIITIVVSLITLDSTYIRIKEFIKHQQLNEHKHFWNMIEEEYLKHLRKSNINIKSQIQEDKNEILHNLKYP